MNAVFSMALKDARILIRDKAGLFFVVGFPFLYAILVGTVFSGSGDQGAMDVVVVDEDATEGSRAFVAALKENDGLAISTGSRDVARTAVRTRKAVAYIVLPRDSKRRARTFSSSRPCSKWGPIRGGRWNRRCCKGC